MVSAATPSRAQPSELLQPGDAGVGTAGLIAGDLDTAVPFAPDAVRGDAMELLVDIAHDMRSPLSSILILVERMRSGGAGPVTPAQERQLGLVYSAAFGLSALASDMMELAHGGARLVGPAPITFSLAAVLHAVRDVVHPIAEEKGLGLRFSAPPSDLRIGHPAALTRVLLNLVTNALKFTSNGSVTVIASAEDDGRVQFHVNDTGRGMPPAVMARVAAGPGTSPSVHPASFSSAGLGIEICRKLLDTMGGSLAFSALQPVGTRAAFTLVLPAHS